MRIEYNRGIVVSDNQTKLFLDPELTSTPIKHTTLITHAHSDHTAGLAGGAKSILTETTFDLYKATHNRNAKNYEYRPMYEPFEIGNFEIEFIRAGHLLGAVQIVVRHGSDSFLYTGDFCPSPLLTVDKADIPKDIDLTVMDSTYGNKKISFDDREDTRQRIFVWIISQLRDGNIPLINVGHLGGAQELIKLFNQLAHEMPILVSKRIAKICEVYQQYGIDLDYISLKSVDVEKYMDEKCVILFPRSFKRLDEFIDKYPRLENRIVRAIVTGQSAKFGFNSFDYAAPLSTHAHFDELIETASKIDPLRLYTHYGYSKEFTNHLNQNSDISFPSKVFKQCKGVNIEDLKQNGVISSFERKMGYTPLDKMFD